ncbi:MAG: DUF1573 domain-containing protein [Planctomycetia bacterium]|nr:DUF1573 domain-containing protein [Planctomycetia bacterium]
MTRPLWALAVLAVWTATAPAQGWAEKMFPKGLTHDFGSQPRGAQTTHSFVITNPYAVTMDITEVKSGCGCVTAYASKRTLAPRESGTIEVRMDGTRYVGAKSVGVRVTVGPKYISSAELRVSAFGRTDVVFNPGQIAFGVVGAGDTPTKTVDVEYVGPLDWKINEVIARDVPYLVEMRESFRRPGQVGYRMTVTLKKDAPIGPLKHELILRTNDPATPNVTVLVEGQVQSSLSVTPSSLSLGVIKPLYYSFYHHGSQRRRSWSGISWPPTGQGS